MNTQYKEETLGQRIKLRRMRLGFTQEELAERMCIPKSTISAYENDKVDIKGSVLKELSAHLQTSPNYLLGYEDESLISEAISLLKLITDEKVKEVLLLQIGALAKM